MRTAIALLIFAGTLAAQNKAAVVKATISGTVKDSNGSPVAEMKVYAVPSEENGQRVFYTPDGGMMVMDEPTGTTDEEGKYAIELPAGTYNVMTARNPNAKSIQLEAGHDATVDFVVPANPTIFGHVLNSNREPVVDGLVWLLKPVYRNGVLRQAVSGPKVTGEDGGYTFDSGLEINRRYYVLADVPPPADLAAGPPPDPKSREPIPVSTYYPSAIRIDSAAAIVLQPGENRGQVDIRIATAPYYCIEGKIKSTVDAPALGFSIQEAALAGTQLARGRGYAGDEGKYHTCGLSTGSYHLATDDSSAEFMVANADVAGVDVSVAAAASVKLVVDWDGPPPGALLPKLNAQAKDTLRKIAGMVGMDQPGDEELEQVAEEIAQGNFLNAHREVLEKRPNDSAWAAEIGKLMGSLLPMSRQVGVILTGIDSAYVGLLRDRVMPGQYSVGVQAFPGTYVKELTYNGLKLTDGILHVANAEIGTLHILMARDAAKLTASVTDGDGKPVPNATVVVVPESATTVAALSRSGTYGRTDQNGSYTVPSLAPVKYRALATTQTIRWDVPEDLEKLLLVMYQANSVELEAKAAGQISLAPVRVY